MKKNIIAGAFAVGLMVVGGTGAYLATAKADTVNPRTFMQQEGITPAKMAQTMNGNDRQEIQKLMQSGNATFEQMLPLMKKTHPNLGDQQLKDLYDTMQNSGEPASCSKSMGNSGQIKN